LKRVTLEVLHSDQQAVDSGHVTVQVQQVQAFRPGRPVPVHRIQG
jgi:hypothetical protein